MKNVFYLVTVSLFILSITACSDDDNASASSANCSQSCEVPIASDEFSATVPANISGNYTLSYNEITSGGSFADGDEVTFNISDNNELSVEFNGECINIKKPILFSQGTTEANFRDNCVFDVIFGVTENTSGELNEINVATLNFQFLGQFAN